MPTYTQTNIYLSVSTPLGQDKLLLVGFRGEESISGLFRYSLEMLSEDKNLSFDSIVGKSATIALEMVGGNKRYVNGVVGRFYQAGTGGVFTSYYAEIYPWLWLLTLTSDSRIFQQMSTPDIIEAVFKNLGLTDYKLALSKSYSQREYCVQYQETAFNFVSRLMEDEGISYFFEHEEGKHTLVLADDASAYAPCPGLQGTVRYESALPGSTTADAITGCTFERQVTTDQYSVGDFNFETPANSLLGSAKDGSKFSIYEYPGGFAKQNEGDQRAKVRLEGQEAPKTLLRGDAFTPAFNPGHTFTLVGHDRDEVNTTYVVSRVAHRATVEHYTNSFEAFPSSTAFRPPRSSPKPVIPGTQTAIVVGKAGEEIYTDQYGRVKVQFHWDRVGKNDENSSCWIRAMQGWAGKNWGSIFIPRVGQEVIVSFLEGDPDRPLITGVVYNADQTVPYPLPANQTRSTIKTNSSKGSAGYNELRFEDKAGSEEIFIHAQKDMNTIVEKGNRTIQVTTGNETHQVKGTRELTITGNETHTNSADFTQDVSGNFVLKVKGDLTIDVTGSVTIKAGQSFTNQAGQALTNQAGTSLTNKAGQNLENQAGQNLTNQAGMSMTNEAGISLTNKGSASQSVESDGIVTVKGALVKLN